jgi:hypothetical protein
METNVETISINGVEYVKKGEIQGTAESLDNMPYVIVRSYSAGVFAGYLEKKEGREVTIRKSRRIWYWDGASSLSQLATEGTSKPENCKFPCEVEKQEILEVSEILYATKKAQESIKEVKVWRS